MHAWNPHTSAWACRHFVLTRAGFLHWFASCEEVTPLDALNLSKCVRGEQQLLPVRMGGCAFQAG